MSKEPVSISYQEFEPIERFREKLSFVQSAQTSVTHFAPAFAMLEIVGKKLTSESAYRRCNSGQPDSICSAASTGRTSQSSTTRSRPAVRKLPLSPRT